MKHKKTSDLNVDKSFDEMNELLIEYFNKKEL